MALPFRNGFELAKAMGYGNLYQASKEKKEKDENNIQMESINMKKVIRLTESDLHRIVKESVKKALTELDRSTMQTGLSGKEMMQRRGKA